MRFWLSSYFLCRAYLQPQMASRLSVAGEFRYLFEN